ncbi:transposase zinc-binding domain-containing protein [Vibrio parahaemolyticus]|nr:transposase zinc-binding domain-containing protein [Vibrio parahaemolyticus]
MPPLHLADILSQGLPHYQQQHRLTRQQYQVCAHILACRTGQLGYQQWRCDQCGHEEQFSCSCRDRHCPRCQDKPRKLGLPNKRCHCYLALTFT